MAEKIWRLEIMADSEEADLLQGLFTLAVSAGWQEDARDNGTLFTIHSDDKAFVEHVAREAAMLTPKATQDLSELDKTDWLQAWRQYFTPVPCGARFVIMPPWLAHLEHSRRKSIIVEPKSAFGTGHHASTRLCLSALSDLADQGRLNRKGWFLDLGCGTGVLGIGACKLGMDGTGLDIDPVAIANARENRELNGADRMELLKGNIDKVAQEKFDLIMANILAQPLIEMAPQIMSCLKKDGVLILGGILDSQAEAVGRAYAALGKPKVSSEGEWRALVWA